MTRTEERLADALHAAAQGVKGSMLRPLPNAPDRSSGAAPVLGAASRCLKRWTGILR